MDRHIVQLQYHNNCGCVYNQIEILVHIKSQCCQCHQLPLVGQLIIF